MGSRRRTLIVLGLVLVLMAASVLVISDKPTQQGLDLAGRHRAGLRGAGDACGARAERRGRRPCRRHHPRPGRHARRLRARDLADRRDPGLGRAPGGPERAGRDRSGRATPRSSLLRLRAERHPAGPGRQRSNGAAVQPPLRRGRGSQKQKPECFEKGGEPLCTSTSGYYYLFDENSLEPIGPDGQAVTDGSGVGPVKEKQDLFLSFDGNAQPEGTIVEHVPQGYVVLREEAPPDDPATEIDESESGAARLVPAAGPARADRRRHPQPGAADFDPVSGEIAERHLRLHGRGPGGVRRRSPNGSRSAAGASRRRSGITDPEQAANLSDCFAVVLDGEIVSRPIINFKENPDRDPGRHGRTDLGQLHDHRRRRTWPSSCGSAPCLSSSTLINQCDGLGDARPGGAGRRDPRRPRRPGAGDPLPARLLPLPRLRRGARPVRLRPLLPGADQAHPDHADPAGHRGTDPHDRRRGRLEHRHLRANKGGDPPRALDAVGDLAGLPQGHRDDHRRERHHPDHGVHPVRARERRASRASRSRSASARSSRCSRPSCSRRRSWRYWGARPSCAHPGSSARASGRSSGSSTSPGCRSTSSRPRG